MRFVRRRVVEFSRPRASSVVPSFHGVPRVSSIMSHSFLPFLYLLLLLIFLLTLLLPPLSLSLSFIYLLSVILISSSFETIALLVFYSRQFYRLVGPSIAEIGKLPTDLARKYLLFMMSRDVRIFKRVTNNASIY